MYLYFGVTPALVLFWPWAALTGHYLFHHHAVAIFCAVGFLATAAMLWGMWRRYFPEVGVATLVACLLALGLAAGVPTLLQRAEFWEVAVSCGYALGMLALAAVWRALIDPKRREWWLAAASLALGLAVGARPFLLLGVPILLVPIVAAWNQPGGAGRRVPWSLLLAAAVPLALCGLGLMLYNDLRFDSPFEFGQRYQLAGDRQDIQHFSLRFLWFNFCVYFLEPVRWTREFPFVGDIATPVLPAGHAPVEDPYGILTNVPIVWFALAAPLACWNRAAAERSILRAFLIAAAILFVTATGVLSLFYGNCSRYESEFLPMMVFLAAVGIFGVDRVLVSRPRWRLVARGLWIALLVFSIGFNLLEGADHYAVQRCRLGNQLDAVGLYPEAIQEYEAALRMKPNLAEAHSNYGNVLRNVGRASEALEECRTAVQLDPSLPGAHNNLANALLDRGQTDEAIAHYQEAIRLKPDEAKTHYNLGNAWLKAGRVLDAIAEYEAALRIDPTDIEAHYNLGNTLLGAGRIPDAIAHYLATIQIKPEYVEARNNLGNALLQLGRTAEAIAQLEAAVRLRPNYAEAHNSLGAALFHVGRKPEAIAQFAAALRLRPDFAEARRNLENVLAPAPAGK
jgi:tetratricopeptide (TPR) repeat protein